MTRHRRIVVGLALALAVAGCTGKAEDPAPAFTEAPCPDDVTSVVVGRLTCGFLTVPENRSDPERTIRVFVARILPAERVHDDPMLVVGVDLAGLPNYGGVAPLAQRVGREVIIMDTRGVGHSTPSLACREVDDLRTTVLASATDDPATRKVYLDAVSACHNRLAGDGISVAAYNLTEMAADAEDLRVALDVDKWNVVTYGTASRIAIQMLRSKPDHLRSLLLDTPEVPGADPRAIAATATRTQVDAVLAACAAERACATAFPGARASLDATLATLAARPATVTMEDTTGSGTITVRYDDAMLLRTLRGMLSDGGSSGPIMVPQAIPAFLAHVNAGRWTQLASTLAPIVTGPQPYCLGYQPKCLPQHKVSAGVLFSVLCHDIAPFHDAQVRTWAARQTPGTSRAYGASPLVNVCGKWPVAGKAAAEVDQQPTGDVPTLIATGAFAPYAPEAVLRDKLSGLTDATFAVDPGNGHNVIGSTDCLAAARTTWLDQLALAPSALACMGDETTPFITDLSTVLDTTTEPAPRTSTRPAPPAQAAALEGTWLVSLTRDDMTAALTAGGFPELSERFFRAEKIPADGTRFGLRIVDGRFSGLYNDGLDEKGEWYVGWSGTVTVRGDQIELKDPKEGTTETQRYAISGDQLTLTPLTATPDTLSGLPTLAYDYAYLAAEPFTRTDCAKVTPPCT